MHLDVLDLVGLPDRAFGIDEVGDALGPARGAVGWVRQHVVGRSHLSLRVGQELERQPAGLCEELVLGGEVERRSEDFRSRLLEPLGSVTEPFTFLRSAAGGRLWVPPEHHPAASKIGE